MKEIVRHQYLAPRGHKGIRTTPELLTAEEAADKYPGWTPYEMSKRIEFVPEPGDLERERDRAWFGLTSPPMPGSDAWKRLHPEEK